jgi:Sulfatase-modifying factor enzyme 1
VVKVVAVASLVAVAIAACGAPSLTFRDDAPAAGVSTTTGIGGSAGDWGDASMGGTNGDGALAGSGGRPDSGTDGKRVSCDNGTVDGEESDVDCGGTACPRCAINSICRQDTDCIGAYCKQGRCAQGSCVDMVKNLKETDVDCGGGDCPACGVGATCISNSDCVQQACTGGKCQSISCDDGILGTGETDVDCGGTECAPCAPGKACLLARDCSSGVCGNNLICASPSCSDGVQNGTETAKDCGGSCAPCADGMGCMGGSDCASGVCAMHTCLAPTCSDKVKNEAESDIDCGGPCPKCPADSSCGKDADCASGNCTGTCQPCPKDMVNVPTTTGGSYCVDAQEVTIGRYNTFLMSNPSTSLLPASCAGNTLFTPSAPLDLAKPNNPVTSVDWCDAYAYCANLGRHLCGRIGGGAPLASNEVSDATKGEWYNACSRGGTQAYPYGNNYVPGSCVDRNGGNVPRAVGAATACVGGYAGLHDMSGNVMEWEDNCVTMPGQQPSTQDTCKARGGAYSDNFNATACTSMSASKKRSASDPQTGFRCCF